MVFNIILCVVNENWQSNNNKNKNRESILFLLTCNSFFFFFGFNVVAIFSSKRIKLFINLNMIEWYTIIMVIFSF